LLASSGLFWLMPAAAALGMVNMLFAGEARSDAHCARHLRNGDWIRTGHQLDDLSCQCSGCAQCEHDEDNDQLSPIDPSTAGVQCFNVVELSDQSEPESDTEEPAIHGAELDLYLKTYAGIELGPSGQHVARSYARIGLEIEGEPVAFVVELGPELLYFNAPLREALSASLFAYYQASPGLEMYLGWDALLTRGSQLDDRFHELTLGGVLTLTDAELALDPLTGIVVVTDGYFIRLEAKSRLSPLVFDPETRLNGYLGWSRQHRRWSLSVELGVVAADLVDAGDLLGTSAKLDLSIYLNPRSEFVMSFDYLLLPERATPSTFSSSISLIRRF
jgi:hypothetical protein